MVLKIDGWAARYGNYSHNVEFNQDVCSRIPFVFLSGKVSLVILFHFSLSPTKMNRTETWTVKNLYQYARHNLHD